MNSDLDRWEKAVEKAADKMPQVLTSKVLWLYDDELLTAAREALPPLLEIARLAAKAWKAQTIIVDELTADEIDKYDVLLRKHTEVREDE